MSFSITNNVASLNARNNLSRSNTALSKSVERLSSGLKINRGADGPASLVISEKQRAQISGLRQAIDNSDKAVSLVQTAEGALGEINSLLVKVRSLALDSANAGYNDDDALAANQAEIANALETIDRIANNTQFGQKKILDGSAGVTGTVNAVSNALVFQIGANQNQTASVALQAVDSSGLGVGVSGNQFSSLADIDVSTAGKAQDTLGVIDAAIDNITTMRGDLGAFQQNTLTSTANNLRTTLENTINAESIIRDTNFAEEISNFTNNQVLVQAGTSVLGNANQLSQGILSLLQ
ncbi:UNVERIFIED_CONTAM: hypothetical protein GTU68_034245 [Idotea baltica]|nr:hypothetical protein [Idotea baltica]